MLRCLSPVAKVCAVAALMALPAACSSTPEPSAGGCYTDDDCAQSELGGFCVAGMCQACRDVLDCDEGLECIGGLCEEPLFGDEEESEYDPLLEEGSPDGMAASSAADVEIPQECLRQDGSMDLPPIVFDYDDYNLRAEARVSLRQSARCLSTQAGGVLLLEGHCDERGTQEYNLALGEKRAYMVRQYLKDLGVSGVEMKTLSKGKNQPRCKRRAENCYSKNRRVELMLR